MGKLASYRSPTLLEDNALGAITVTPGPTTGWRVTAASATNTLNDLLHVSERCQHGLNQGVLGADEPKRRAEGLENASREP